MLHVTNDTHGPAGPFASSPPGTGMYGYKRGSARGRMEVSGLLGLLSVTEAGFFSQAAGHECERPCGAPEAIVMVCVDGQGEVSVGSARAGVSRGQIVIVPPGVAHRYRASSAAPWSIWWMHVEGSDVPALLRSVLAVQRGPVFVAGNVTEVLASMRQVHEATGRGSPPSRCLASAAAWRLFALLAVAEEEFSEPRAVVSMIRDSILNDPSADIHLPRLAARAGISVSRFSALFRELAGTGVVAFARRERMARAKSLLATSKCPVVTVARLVGYSDPLYFSRLFRADVGMSPTAYRKSKRGEKPL
jgi:AraC family transcriptional regulator, arabinose operon regulatory protein